MGATDLFTGLLKDFGASLAADLLVYGKGGHGKGSKGENVESNIEGGFLNFSKDDEAAFIEALAYLGSEIGLDKPSLSIKAQQRLEKLGDIEAISFKHTLVKLKTLDDRAKVLLWFATLPEDEYKRFVEVTGAAVAGNVAKLQRWIKTLPASLNKWWTGMESESIPKLQKAQFWLKKMKTKIEKL